MDDFKDVKCSSEMADVIDHDYENNLQHELDNILDFGSDNEDDDDDDDDEDALVIDDDCILFENDFQHMGKDLHSEIDFTDPSITSLFRYENRNVLCLTPEEEEVITGCLDPELQRCLVLNRLKMLQLNELHSRLLMIRNSCSDNIKKECEKLSIQRARAPSVIQPKTYIWKLGTPYFKDHLCYGAPPNLDFINKHQNNEYVLTQFSEGRRWVDEDQMILRNSVETSYYNYCELQIEQQMRDIERQLKSAADANKKRDLENRLENFQTKMEMLWKEKPQKTPPFKSDVGIDWLKVANNDLRGQHSVYECKAMWNIYLHPYISKKDWSVEENEKIKWLAKKHKYQDWDLIADELATNRSGYLVCVHYYTKLCDKFKRERFLPNEDEFLMEVVENCRLGSYIPWATVARYFEDRSKHQLYHRYKYYLSCKNVIKKGVFTEAEDVLLVYLVQHIGKDYTKISSYIPHRTSIQLRNRYSNYLEKLTINLGNYTAIDDQRILDHVKVHGDKKWTLVAKQLKRTRAHVRQRHLTLQKWLKKNPNLKLQEIPRRKQNFLSRYQWEKQERMPFILKKLSECKEIPTLQMVEVLLRKQEQKPTPPQRKWRIYTKKNSFTLLDQTILEFFKGACRYQRETKVVTEHLLTECARRILKILDLLGNDVNLLRDTKDDKETSCLSVREREILNIIQQILNDGTEAGPRSLVVNSEDAAVPSTSQSDPLSLETSQCQIKSLVPPTLNTLLGARGLLLKYEVYKETTNTTFISNVKLDSTKTALEDPMVWKMEQILLKRDCYTRNAICNDRQLFWERFYALFWLPSLMSRSFPEHLENAEPEEPQKVSDVIIESPKAGRPSKKAYPKVRKMLEARKRKKALMEGKDYDESATNTDQPNTNGTTSAAQPKEAKPKIRKPRKPKPEHAIRYLPRRAKTKSAHINQTVIHEYLNDSDSSAEMRAAQNDSTPTQGVCVQRIVNVSDLKLPTANIPLVDRNVLMKLDQASANRIVVLEQPSVAVYKNIDDLKCDLPQKQKILKALLNNTAAKSSNTQTVCTGMTRIYVSNITGNQIHTNTSMQKAGSIQNCNSDTHQTNNLEQPAQKSKPSRRKKQAKVVKQEIPEHPHLTDEEISRLNEIDIVKQEIDPEDVDYTFEEDLQVLEHGGKRENRQLYPAASTTESFQQDMELEFTEMDHGFEDDIQMFGLNPNGDGRSTKRPRKEFETDARSAQPQLSKVVGKSCKGMRKRADLCAKNGKERLKT